MDWSGDGNATPRPSINKQTHTKKQFILVIARLVVCIAGASAQEEGDTEISRWSFGTRAGTDFCEKNNLGFGAELLSDCEIGKRIYFRTGLGFRQFNHKYTPPKEIYGDVEDCKSTGNTVFVPLHLAWRLPIADMFSVDLETGIHFSYGIGGKTDWSSVGIPQKNTYDSGFKNRYNYGLECGAGIRFKILYLGVSIAVDDYDRESKGTPYCAIKLGYTFK